MDENTKITIVSDWYGHGYLGIYKDGVLAQQGKDLEGAGRALEEVAGYDVVRATTTEQWDAANEGMGYPQNLADVDLEYD